MTWGNLFRHETLSKEEVVVQMAVKYFRACMTNFVKVSHFTDILRENMTNRDVTRAFIYFSLQTGFPSKNDSPSCAYSRVDFDSDGDFYAFFGCKSCKFTQAQAFRLND